MDHDDLERRARAKLPPDFYDYVAGGAEEEVTLAENESAWRRHRLRPHVLRDVRSVDTSTRVLGARVASPLGIAPMAMQHRACDEGALATASAAARCGSLLVFGLFGAGSAAAVAAQAGEAPQWLQVYPLRDRGRTVGAIERSIAQGYRALVLTVDVVRQGNRLRDRRNAWRFLAQDAKAEEDPDEIFDRSLTFDDVAWFCERSRVPVVVKGVMRGDDASRCVEAGAAAVVVSNHGGRQLDGAAATADVLRDVVDGVAGRGEVYVDGGIRRGQHVVKALALGATAVLLGRPVMWALATDGERGVEALLRSLNDEIERSMALCGVRSVDEIGPDLLLDPGRG